MKHDSWSSLGEMAKTEAMVLYLETIHELLETGEFDSEVLLGQNDEYERLLEDLELLKNDYALIGVDKPIEERYSIDISDGTMTNFRREECSLFQPGSEVILDVQNQHSLLETVQDLVQHDIVDNSVEEKQFMFAQEDPLNVMEPRPLKNLSEESLIRTAKSYTEVYELLLETNRRIDLLEMKINALVQQSPLSKLAGLLEHKVMQRGLKVTLSGYYHSHLNIVDADSWRNNLCICNLAVYFIKPSIIKYSTQCSFSYSNDLSHDSATRRALAFTLIFISLISLSTSCMNSKMNSTNFSLCICSTWLCITRKLKSYP